MPKEATRLARERLAASTEHQPRHDDIAALAYARWQEKGCPQGTTKRTGLARNKN